MKWRLALGLLLLMVLVAACSPKECTKSADCRAPPSGVCGSQMRCSCSDDNTCEYQAIERPECFRAIDCVQKSGFNVTCQGSKCQYVALPSPPPPAESRAMFEMINDFGNQFKIDVLLNQPFSIKADSIRIRIELTQPGQGFSEFRITKLELEAYDAKNQQKMILGGRKVSKPLWVVGDQITEYLAFDFPTSELKGEFQSLVLRVYYTARQAAGTSVEERSSTMVWNLNSLTLVWNSEPPKKLPRCDDGNPGTDDRVVDRAFCDFIPKKGVCGNYACDEEENRCTCKKDCGPCGGMVGKYLENSCVEESCVPVLSDTAQIKPILLEESYNIGGAQVGARFSYPNPFDTASDKLKVEMSLSEKQPDVLSVRILSVKVFDASESRNLIAEADVRKSLIGPTSKASAQLEIPGQGAEVDRLLSIVINYELSRQLEEGAAPQVTKGTVEKSLNTITIIDPT